MRFLQALSFAVLMLSLAPAAHALNPQPEPPGQKVQLNPQPEPPGATDADAHKGVALNPQPEPPGATDAAHTGKSKLNPQPEPPGVKGKRRHERKHPVSTDSDSRGKKEQPPARDSGADDNMADPTVGMGAESGGGR